MQSTFCAALWSDITQPSTSQIETPIENDVTHPNHVLVSDQEPDVSAKRSTRSRSRRNAHHTFAQQSRLVHPFVYALIYLLLIVATEAAPVPAQSNQLQDSLIYSSLLRWVFLCNFKWWGMNFPCTQSTNALINFWILCFDNRRLCGSQKSCCAKQCSLSHLRFFDLLLLRQWKYKHFRFY